MGKGDVERTAPILTDEGEALLARVVERHASASAQSADRRRTRDALRAGSAEGPEPVELRIGEDLPGAAPAESSERRDSLIPKFLVAIAASGVVVLGLAVSLFLSQQDRSGSPATEVAGINEVNVDGSEAQADPEGGGDGNENAVDQSAGNPPVPPATPVTSADGLGLTVYEANPPNNGIRSFAIRVSNDGRETIESTDVFTVEVEMSPEERVPAMVRFVHQELPVGTSAVASVRVEDVPEGPLKVILSSGDLEIAAVELS